MRAKQEQQRAEKAARLGKAQPKAQKQNETAAKKASQVTKKRHKGADKFDANQVQLFAHLQEYNPTNSDKVRKFLESNQIPSEIIKLGLKYADGTISGSNARSVAMLTTFQKVIRDYQTPADKSLHRDLELYIRPCIDFLSLCRPKSISMGNSITFLKQRITRTAEMTEEEAKDYLHEEIDSYISERIAVSQFIAEKANTKIVEGDVVLVYGTSTSVEATLKLAHSSGKRFKVIIVDSRPKFEGRGLLHRLAAEGLECCYILLNAISFIMTEVTKVFLGAFAMLTNGNLISRSGNAVVAMMAHRFNIPVMVCCETYKFVERGQLDSICFNEVGNPDDLVSGGPTDLKDWRSMANLKLLNLHYDLTPIEFLTVVITEVGLVPPTSVPVILREQNSIEAPEQ